MIPIRMKRPKGSHSVKVDVKPKLAVIYTNQKAYRHKWRIFGWSIIDMKNGVPINFYLSFSGKNLKIQSINLTIAPFSASIRETRPGE